MFSINLIDSISGWSSPHNFVMFSIRPLEIISFVVDFQQLRPTLLRRKAPSCSFMVEVDVIFSVLSIPLFCSRGIVMLLSSPIILFYQDHVLFHAYPFNRGVVSSLQVPFILSSLAPLFSRSAAEFCFLASLQSK